MNSLVPEWFIDNLHEIIYSDMTKSWLLVQGLARSKHFTELDLKILRKHSAGITAAGIALLLRMNRRTVRRHLKCMRMILGDRFMSLISQHRSVVGEMARFSRRRDSGDANVNTVLHELSLLNANEIGVLCCMVQKLSEHESLMRVNIKRRQYYDIKSKLRCMMKIPL